MPRLAAFSRLPAAVRREAYPLAALAGAITLVSTELSGLRVAAVLLMAYPVLIDLAVNPGHVFAVLIVGSIALGDALAMSGIDVGIRIYPLDLLLVAAAVGALAIRRSGGPRNGAGDGKLVRWTIVCLACYGLFSLGLGLAAGNPSRDALGEFRRMFLYPIAGLLLFRVYARSQPDLRRLIRLVAASGLVLLCLLLFRVITGRTYHEEAYGVEGEVVRYLSYSEAAGASLVALTALTASVVTPRTYRSLLLIVFTLFTLLVISSNYRTAWLALLVGVCAAGIILGARRPGLLLRAFAVSALVAVVALLLLRVSPLWPLVLRKFSFAGLASTGSWRLFSWLKAFSVFRAHPVLGVGLGYQHEFLRPGENLQGVFLNRGNTIHNDVLWVLVNTGLVGLGLFALLWSSILQRGYASTKVGSPLARDVRAAFVATCAGQLAVVTVTAMFEPTVSLGANGVILGLLAAGLLGWGSQQRSNADATQS